MAGPANERAEGAGRDEVELLAEELLARRRKGERPTIAEYQERHPDLAAEIGEVFPTLLLVDELRESSPGVAAPNPIGEPEGLRQVGEYRIHREIGRGGMGIVYEAEQESLGRRVALKILPLHSLLDRKRLERFHEEARAAAQLSHPNIVPVYGVGEHLGLHYFVMQYIPGHGLDRIIEDVRRMREDGASSSGISSDLSATGRGGRERYRQSAARIARDAALALEHAHGEGILHRDVKPSNLLLDRTGHVWLADFGLAKSEGGDDLTQSGDVAGTVRYMAPERFKGWSDPRSDVYALGLTLYELLALRPAFVERDRARLIRKVTSEDPPPLRRIDRAIGRDLETIILKAIAKEPSQRYASARALADDLDRYLLGVPVEARRSTALWRFSRWCLRNRALASLGAAVLLLLITVAVVTWSKNVNLTFERDAGRQKLRDASLAQARALRFSGRPGQRFGALAAIQEAARIQSGPDLRDEGAACLSLQDVRLVKSWAHEQDVIAMFDGDVRRVALVYPSGAVVVRTLEDDREVLRCPAPGSRPAYVDAYFHPDGRYLCVRFFDGRLDHWVVWNLDQKTIVARIDDGAGAGGFDFDPRDGSLVLPTHGGTLRSLDLSSGRTTSEVPMPVPPVRLAIHPGGELVAVIPAEPAEKVHLCERSSGRIVRSFRHEAHTSRVAWHPSGRLMAVACYDFHVYLWDAETGALWWSAQGKHEAEVVGVTFHPEGDMLFSDSWDNKLQAWDPWSGQVLFVVPGDHSFLSRDGRLLGIRKDLGYEVRELAPRPDGFKLSSREEAWGRPPLLGVTLAPSGRIAATWGDDGVRICDLVAREELAFLPLPWTRFAGFGLNGANLITVGQDGLLKWPLRSRDPTNRHMVLGPPEPAVTLATIGHAALGDGGRSVAFVHGADHGHIVNLEKSEEVCRLETVPGLKSIAYSPDGRWVAAYSTPLKGFVIWDGAKGKKLKVLQAPNGSVAFDSLGRYLVAGPPAEYLFFRTQDWEPMPERRIPRDSGLPFAAPISFDPRGDVMAITQTASLIRLIDVESGNCLAELEAPDPRTIHRLALDCGTGYLAASSRHERCSVWDLGGIEGKLSSLGLPWTLRAPHRGAGERERTHLQVVESGELLGSPEDFGNPRSPGLLRRYCRALFRPRLESYEDIDIALAAPRFLVREGSDWRFLRGREIPSPGLEWTELQFDDTAWESGASGLSGHASRDGETATVLADQPRSYAVLHARHVFDWLEAEKIEQLWLSLRFEDGFVAYLNGKEVARKSPSLSGDRASTYGRVEPEESKARQDFLAPLSAALLLRGKNVLAVKVVTCGRDSRLFLLPVLAATLTPDAVNDRRSTGTIAKARDGGPDPILAAYSAGRILQREGRIDDALAAFERAGSLDPASPEPILRRLECLRSRGEAVRAKSLAAETLLSGGLMDDQAVWTEWLLTSIRDLRLPLRDVLLDWPRDTAGEKESYGKTLRAVLEELAGSGAVRIRCGGPRLESKDGKVWSADRFFLGGFPSGETDSAGEPPKSAGGEEETIHGTHRWFTSERQIRPAYRVPIAPGLFTVSLHFAETYHRLPGERVFTVLLERKAVLEGYEPLRAGFAIPDVKTFGVEVADGFLDLDFLAVSSGPMISAIEIERAAQ